MMFRTFIASRLFYRFTRVYMDVAGRSGDFCRIWRNPRRLISDYLCSLAWNANGGGAQ